MWGTPFPGIHAKSRTFHHDRLVPEQRAVKWLDKLPWWPLLFGALLLGLAPFAPEPHLVEKLRMLVQGDLRRPIDVFDLVIHGVLPALLLLKLIRLAYAGRAPRQDG